MKRNKKKRVGSSAQLITPSTKVLTTHQLLEEMNRRYVDGENNKRTKFKRKNPGQQYHPQPNPPGPNTKIINKSDHSQHPPAADSDPALPPMFLGFGSEMPQTGPAAPTLVEGQAPPQNLNTPKPQLTGGVPSPFKYLTPAQARAQGTYRQ